MGEINAYMDVKKIVTNSMYIFYQFLHTRAMWNN